MGRAGKLELLDSKNEEKQRADPVPDTNTKREGGISRAFKIFPFKGKLFSNGVTNFWPLPSSEETLNCAMTCFPQG